MDSRSLWAAYGTQLVRQTLPTFDPTSQRVAFGSVALVTDVANPLPAVANESIFRFANTVPAWSAAWTVHSSVAGEYGLFLDNAAAAQPDPALNAARLKMMDADNTLQPTPFNMPVAAGDAAMTVFAPKFTLPDFDATYAKWVAAQRAGETTTIHVDETAADERMLAMAATDAAELFALDDLPPFFSFGAPLMAAADGAAESFETSSLETSSLTVTFSGLDAVPIAQGPWFDEALLRRFRDDVPPVPPFFGPAGSFALLPAYIVLGFGGTLDLNLAPADYRATDELLGSGVPVRFASFLVGNAADAVAPTAAAELDQAAQTIHISNLGNGLPLMLAVISRIL